MKKNQLFFQQLFFRYAGFTMIENLATLLIFSIGIFGALGMQTTSLGLSQNSYYRTQAMIAANDIIDRMRLNQEGADAGYYRGYDSSSPPSDPGCMNGSFCDSSTRAQSDLHEWSRYFNKIGDDSWKPLLPKGTAVINFDSLYNEYIVEVSWNELDWNADGSNLKIDQTKKISIRVSI